MPLTTPTPTIGITFSPRQAVWLGLEPVAAFKKCLGWPVSVIRLGAYWSELELQSDEVTFDTLLPYMELCEQHGRKVVLTVGVKAPRYPEYYFPPHVEAGLSVASTQQALFSFVKKTVQATQGYRCITAWQVENEPLDPSGPSQLEMPLALLEQEVALVRTLDPRPVVLNLWGNNLSERGFLPIVSEIADIVGLDMYYKQYVAQILGKNVYLGPKDSDQVLTKMINDSQKPIWIVELQAEPWEKDDEEYRGELPQSMSVDILEKNWNRAKKLGATTILFWGAEYWLWQEGKGNKEYVEFIERVGVGK